MFILRSHIKSHITRAVNRERRRMETEHRRAMAEQAAHNEEMLERQQAEYEAILDSYESKIASLQAEIRANERLVEIVRSGAKSNNRIAADLVHWADRFLKTGADAYQEVQSILDDASGQVRRLER